jgi:UDP-3-O-[3-hydroxymyristoyl] glucosamine N-acyltransferase
VSRRAPSGPVSAGEIAVRVGARIEGDGSREILGIASLEHAGPTDLSFCGGGRWLRALAGTGAGVVLVADGVPVPKGVVALRHPSPRLAFARAASAMFPPRRPDPGVHPRAWVHPEARVDPTATVDAFAVVEAGATVGPRTWVMAQAYVGRDCVVGSDCRLQPGSVTMDGAVLGDRVVLKPGAVVGSDGFGHVPTADVPTRMPQLGATVLEDDVEIGANSCVDRAAIEETRVGRGSRLDNLVQIAHGVRVGASCLLAAYSGVAGGASLGDRVVMAGRAAVVDGVEVGAGAVLAGLTSAGKNVPPGRKIAGSPARSYQAWLREFACLRELPEALRRLDRLERLAGVDRVSP